VCSTTIVGCHVSNISSFFLVSFICVNIIPMIVLRRAFAVRHVVVCCLVATTTIPPSRTTQLLSLLHVFPDIIILRTTVYINILTPSPIRLLLYFTLWCSGVVVLHPLLQAIPNTVLSFVINRIVVSRCCSPLLPTQFNGHVRFLLRICTIYGMIGWSNIFVADLSASLIALTIRIGVATIITAVVAF
jgi:hypothetical protein